MFINVQVPLSEDGYQASVDSAGTSPQDKRKNMAGHSLNQERG